MRPTHFLLTFAPIAFSLFSIAPARGDDPATEFTVAFEWAAAPTLTLSKGQGDTYRISLDVDSLPPKRFPALLAELHEHHAPQVAAVQLMPREEKGDNVRAAITFESIQSGQVGATLKLLIDLLDLQEITMDANVFEGKSVGELLNFLGANKSAPLGHDFALDEFHSAIESSLPDAKPNDSGWRIEIEGYHRFEEVK